MSEPLRFVFGVHVHQPVGNFDHIFEDHVRGVYRPFLERLAAAECLPISLHVSGPLLEWLDSHDSAYLDLVGRLAADGKVELLLAGFYEPILAMLPRADRIEQVAWMREELRRRFGVEARGLWLTERVWEPDLAADLADAGAQYAFVDDRHFLVCGFRREQLHAPLWTEHGGRRLALLPIDERLRYLVPFREPDELAAYVRETHAAGRPLAVLADDGEKFGGWPGTRDWVFTRGWLDRFLAAMRALRESGALRLVTGAEAVREVPSGGLAYLPTASYREMETWALPAEAGARLVSLEKEWGHERLHGPLGPLLRGAHWRHFLVKYSEANRMHKTMVALSALCRERGDPPAARRAIGRAQCNDAYWHGVFGGLYLPHLRAALWRQLALAEAELRRGEQLAWESLDLDCDGNDELWVHSEHFSALVAPHRGGAVEVLLRFAGGVNLADALTRRREAYHEALPPVDSESRGLLIERVVDHALTQEKLVAGGYPVLFTWAAAPMAWRVERVARGVEVALEGHGLQKRLRFSEDGRLSVAYRWDPLSFPPGSVFTTELSSPARLTMTCDPSADLWHYPIVTVAKSERGLEETVQGHAQLLRWPASLGGASLEVGG